MISEADKNNLVVGFKQTIKIITENRAKKVFVAEDCEDRLRNLLSEALKQNNVETEYIDTMRELGKQCGINIGASCAVIVKN